MNKTIFLGLTIGVIVVAMITLATVSKIDFIAMGAVKCTEDFWSRTCCWDDLDDDGNVVTKCKTCLSDGNGGYFGCKTTTKAGAFTPQPGPACPKFGCPPTTTPGPATGGLPAPKGGIFDQGGNTLPTPGPATGGLPSQPTPQGPFPGEDIPRGGIFQGNLLESYSTPGLVQSDPDSLAPQETNTTQPEGIIQEDLRQLGATQDNETTSEDDVTEVSPATEENTTAVPQATEDTQPALVQEEPVPPVCPEGQVLDEETNLCVLEEPEADEQEQEEQEQPQQQEEAEEQSSDEENGN